MAKAPGTIDSLLHTVTLVASVAGLIGTFLGLKQRYDHQVIEAGRMYSSIDVSRLLEIERSEVVALIRRKTLDARKGDSGNFRISGQAIMNYMVRQQSSAQAEGQVEETGNAKAKLISHN